MKDRRSILTNKTLLPEQNDCIATAASLLKAGKVIAFPTETVYGLGADISIPAAVRQIFEIKNRPANHPLIVHFSGLPQLEYWADEVPESAWQLAEHFWPGPLTIILRRSRHIPPVVTGGQDTVGLRIPAHPVALALLKTLGSSKAIAAPSANRFGRISPTTAAHVREELGQAVSMILDGGACTVGLESTIVSFIEQTPVVHRPGGISLAALEEVMNCHVILANKEKQILHTPGSLASHYAPTTPLGICASPRVWQYANYIAAQGLRVMVILWSAAINKISPENKNIQRLLMPQEAKTYGKQLYATLRQLDQEGYDYLLFEAPPDQSEWLAISDRLQRASYNNPKDKYI